MCYNAYSLNFPDEEGTGRYLRSIFFFMEGEKSGILTMYVKSYCSYRNSDN